MADKSVTIFSNGNSSYRSSHNGIEKNSTSKTKAGSNKSNGYSKKSLNFAAQKDLIAYMLKLQGEHEKLDNLVRKSNRVIFQCSTVFPFDFFTDKLIVDEKKVNLISKTFFFSESVHSILLTNLLDVEIDTSIFFATMKLIPNTMPNDPVIVNYLQKTKAYEARRIIQGLLVCEKENIDLSALTLDDLKNKIREVGAAAGVQ